MQNEPAADPACSVSLLDMVLSCARAVDFLHPGISEHHLRVACIAATIAQQMELSSAEVHDVLVGGALHDIAAVCRPVWRGLLDQALSADEGKEGSASCPGEAVHQHGYEGYILLRDFSPFAHAAEAIRFHHVDWQHGAGNRLDGHAVPLASHILHLADRAALLPDDEQHVLECMQLFRHEIFAEADTRFHPDVVHAFDEASRSEAFWLDVVSRRKEELLKTRYGATAVRLTQDGLYRVAEIFGRIIDYRSSYTACHSSGVAATSELLARCAGMPLDRQRLIGVAGYLHDIGKLSLPNGLVDKAGRLTEQEVRLMRQHPYYTRQILAVVPGLEQVCAWASLHHERLDGTGYPFRTDALVLEARIVGVADIFTAITEDRPYRRGMDCFNCLATLDDLVTQGAIDGRLVSIIKGAYDLFSKAGTLRDRLIYA